MEIESKFFDTPNVKTIDGSFFEGAKIKDENLCVVYFYAVYCGFCKRSKSDYVTFAGKVPFINVYAMDGPENTQTKECINIEYNNIIKGWPTIIFFDNRKPVYVVPANETSRKSEKLIDIAMDLKLKKAPI